MKFNMELTVTTIRNVITKLIGKKIITDYIHQFPRLTKSEETKAFEMLTTDAKRAQEILIVQNLWLVAYISKSYICTGVSLEDLFSIGSLGLIKAVKTFRPDDNIVLTKYASRCVENEILMFLRKTLQWRSGISIDEFLNTDREENELPLSNILSTDEDTVYKGIESEVEKTLLRQEIKKLNERERTIIEMRFGLNGRKEMTQREVGLTLGTSQSNISRIEKNILKTLRTNLETLC